MKPTILVTRPLEQAQAFIQKAKVKGLLTTALPCIEIQPRKIKPINLTDYDMAILISINAAKYALPELNKLNSIEWYAVGPSTAQTAQSLGVKHLTVPKTHNSEGLLEVIQNVKNKNILIFRGNGGRELLAEKLSTQGAKVTFVECYERIKPNYPESKLTKLWNEQSPNLIILTSCEILQNLYDITPEPFKAKLLACKLIVASERVATLAKQLHFTGNIINAKTARDEKILALLDA